MDGSVEYCCAVAEFNGYRAELVAPYLRDSLTEKQLVKEAYDHMKESVEVDHLIWPMRSTMCHPNWVVNGLDISPSARAKLTASNSGTMRCVPNQPRSPPCAPLGQSDHMKESVEVDHLMVPLEKKALIDSLRQALVNGADFTATAQQYLQLL